MKRNFRAFGLEFFEQSDHIMVMPPCGCMGDWFSLEGITFDELLNESKKARTASEMYDFIESYVA